MEWNASPVLVQWILQKKGKDPVILAGHFQSETMVQKPKQSEADTTPGDLIEDPWKTWLDNKGSTGMLSQPASLKKGPSAPSTMPARKIESPIEDRFTQQQNALQDLRDKSEKDMESLKGDIAKLEKTISAQQQQMQQNQELNAAEFQAVRKESQTQLRVISTTFQESLQKALKQHDQQMYAQFNELKELMSSKGSKMSPPQKKQKPGNKEDDADACL